LGERKQKNARSGDEKLGMSAKEGLGKGGNGGLMKKERGQKRRRRRKKFLVKGGR